MSEVPRTSRVQIIRIENEKLPAIATIAAGVNEPRRRPERDHDADKTGDHRQPAPPADMLAQQQRRHRGDVNRPGQIKRHHVGERHIGQRPVEAGDLEGREHRAQTAAARAAARS